MEIEVISDLKECELLWNKFSSKRVLWDLWDIITCFHNNEREKPYFIVTKNDKNEVNGLLPICKDKDNEVFFIGGGFMENRNIWINSEKLSEILQQMNGKILLSDMNLQSMDNIPDELKQFCKNEGFRFHLNLKSINYDFSKHLSTFTLKHRKNLLYDLRKLKNNGCIVTWEAKDNFDKAILFNKDRFGDESDYHDIEFVNEMKSLISLLDKKGLLHTCTITLNGNIEAIEYGAFYNNIYYVINGGYNRKIPNIGKLLIMEHINNAINLKADEIDFMSGEAGWKELWNFSKEPYYTLRIKPKENIDNTVLTSENNKNLNENQTNNNNNNNNNNLNKISTLNTQPSQGLSVDSLKSRTSSAGC
jgi:hypothetical protein